VFESWEGAHNVLVEQVRRDAARFGLVPIVLSDLRRRLAALPPGEDAATVEAALADLEPRLERGLTAPLHFRRQLGALVRAQQATWLLVEAPPTGRARRGTSPRSSSAGGCPRAMTRKPTTGTHL
jgi:hypothetical protein